jgi:hypothetical protein
MTESRAVASVHPVPPQEPSVIKAPLRRIVQLLKRYRDLFFLGDENRPASILLTTLAGNHYRAQTSIADGLEAVLDATAQQIHLAGTGRIVVHNPADLIAPRAGSPEDLAQAMTDSTYAKFKRMIETMRGVVHALRNPAKPGAFGESLKALAGTRAAGAASALIQDRVREASAGGLLGVGLGAPAIHVLGEPKVSGGVQPVRGNTFHVSN